MDFVDEALPFRIFCISPSCHLDGCMPSPCNRSRRYLNHNFSVTCFLNRTKTQSILALSVVKRLSTAFTSRRMMIVCAAFSPLIPAVLCQGLSNLFLRCNIISIFAGNSDLQSASPSCPNDFLIGLKNLSGGGVERFFLFRICLFAQPLPRFLVFCVFNRRCLYRLTHFTPLPS